VKEDTPNHPLGLLANNAIEFGAVLERLVDATLSVLAKAGRVLMATHLLLVTDYRSPRKRSNYTVTCSGR